MAQQGMNQLQIEHYLTMRYRDDKVIGHMIRPGRSREHAQVMLQNVQGLLKCNPQNKF